jgi:hypothetical protein
MDGSGPVSHRSTLYAKNSWEDIMIEAGLDQPEAQRGCPIATTYMAEMAHDVFRGLFEISSLQQAHIMPPQMFATLERRLGWHMLIVGRPL